MPVPETCPFCGVDFRYEADGETYSRVIGIVHLGADVVKWWQCPDCKRRWDRDQ